jgi:hypothetical protein
MVTTRLVSALLALVAATAAGAQQPASSVECEDGAAWLGWRKAAVCEVREVTLPATGKLQVDGGPNGGVQVTGGDRSDVSVRATIYAWSADDEVARATLREVVVHTDGVIRATGPERRGGTGWSVGYEILAPRSTDVDLKTVNGGIAIRDLRGDLAFATTNGGVSLEAVAGNVRGGTTNGGVSVTLTGERWDGESLNVRTTNGGVQVRVPEDYSARFEARTVNGGLRVDFPVTTQGRIGRELSATLGDGGALVRAETTNGGVQVSRY